MPFSLYNIFTPKGTKKISSADAEDKFSLVEIHTPKAKKLIVLALTSSL